MHPYIHRSALLAGLIAASAGAQAQDAHLARNLAATCANCHGTNGYAQPGHESLAGKDKADIAQKMLDFKAGRKPATLMHQISKGYSEAQLELVAAYFAARK